MAKTKPELVARAAAAGVIPSDAEPDDFTVAQLEDMLSGEEKAHDRRSATEEIVAADGHVVLSKDDIKARDA